MFDMPKGVCRFACKILTFSRIVKGNGFLIFEFQPFNKAFLLTSPELCFFFLDHFYCFCLACAYVYCCLVGACWEGADLLALVCDV